MPETRFLIRWPDGSPESCYSPSLVIEDYLDRVKAKYGVPCGRALAQLARIEAAALRFASEPDACVAVDAFERDGEALERPST